MNKRKNADMDKTRYKLIVQIDHEVRTPLTIIKEGVSLLLEEIPGGLNPTQKKLLSKIKNNVDRLVLATEKILEMSK